MKTRVLICGATGFIGRNLTEQLSKRSNLEVHATRFQRDAYDCPNVIWHQADLRNPENIEPIIKDMDVLIQAAGAPSDAKDMLVRPSIHVTDNAVLNSYLFQAAFEHRLKHVIFFSCTVMYSSSDRALKESDFDAARPLQPRYFGVGNTKLYLEKICEFYASISDIKFTAIRHSNVYGPHDKFFRETNQDFASMLTKVMTAKDKVHIWGTGEEAFDLIYANDLVRFVELSIKNQTEQYRLYNCGYGQAISVNDLVQKLIAHSGKNLSVVHDLSHATNKTSLFLDCSLAKQEIDWEVATDLDTGIKETIAWWEENTGRKMPLVA